jgi:hypothetical protein
MSFGELMHICVLLRLCCRVYLGLAVSSYLFRYMCRPCCPLIPSPCIVLFVFVEDGCSLLFSASVGIKWIVIQQLPAPFSLLGDFNPVYMIGRSWTI